MICKIIFYNQFNYMLCALSYLFLQIFTFKNIFFINLFCLAGGVKGESCGEYGPRCHVLFTGDSQKSALFMVYLHMQWSDIRVKMFISGLMYTNKFLYFTIYLQHI